MYNLQTSAVSKMDEKKESTKSEFGIFEVLEPIIKSVKVHKPFKDGKAFSLEFEIDSEHPLIDKELADSTKRSKARELWRTVSYNGFIFTSAFYDKSKGTKVWTHYIKTKIAILQTGYNIIESLPVHDCFSILN